MRKVVKGVGVTIGKEKVKVILITILKMIPTTSTKFS